MVKELINLDYQKGKTPSNIKLTIDTEIQKLCNELIKR